MDIERYTLGRSILIWLLPHYEVKHFGGHHLQRRQQGVHSVSGRDRPKEANERGHVVGIHAWLTIGLLHLSTAPNSYPRETGKGQAGRPPHLQPPGHP